MRRDASAKRARRAAAMASPARAGSEPMMHAYDLPLFPEQASTIAAQVDYFYFFLIAVSLFFGV